MNMMPNQDFANNLEATGLDKTNGSNPALARLMQAWESKQGKNAKKAGGLGLVAVSLSACGSDSDPAPSEPGGVGQIFNLVIGDDNLTGTEFADTFNALLASATGSLTGVLGLQTLGDTDIIDGGEGQDVLNAVLNGTGLAIFDLAAPTITDVEEFYLTARNDGAGLDLFNSSGYEQLWMVNSDADLTLDNVRENAALGLDGVTGGNTYYVNYTSSADTSVQNVIANALGTSEASGQVNLDIDTAAGEGFGTLNLAVSNIVRLDLRDEAADMEVFNITGSGVTELSGEDEFENLVELDSTGYTGDLTLDVSGSVDLESVATAGGDDVITIQDINADGGLSVNLGAGDDVLALLDKTPEVPFGFVQILQGEEISSWDFTGGVAGVETLSILTDVYLRDSTGSDPVGFREDATLDLDGFDANLSTITFDAVWGDDKTFALRNAPEALDIEAGMFDNLDLDTGNVVDLTITVNGDDSAKGFGEGDLGELDINDVTGAALETLTLVNTSTPELADTDAGDTYLDINSGADQDVSALESISVTTSDYAEVDLDAEALVSDMNALTDVSVVAGGDADLEMNGYAGVQQVQTFETTGGADAGEYTFDVPGIEDPVVVAFVGGSATDVANQVITYFNNNVPGYTAVLAGSSGPGLRSFDIVRDQAGPADQIVLTGTSFGTDVSMTDVELTEAGIAPDGFTALENVVVDADLDAYVSLDGVLGSFTLDVTAGEDAFLDDAFGEGIIGTGVTAINVAVGTDVEYQLNIDDEPVNFDQDDDDTGEATDTGTDIAVLDLIDNASLETVTVSGARANIEIVGDHSSLTTVDLTGVTEEFSVDASVADFAEGSNVFYLIGATSSEVTNLNGDSALFLGDGTTGDVREVVTFTEADFGTVVINNFTAESADPNETDRIDLSDLGFTNEGQLDFEVGSYDGDGVFNSGAGNDVRITDGNLADGASMGGEIIVLNIDTTPDGIEALQSNIVYL